MGQFEPDYIKKWSHRLGKKSQIITKLARLCQHLNDKNCGTSMDIFTEQSYMSLLAIDRYDNLVEKREKLTRQSVELI